MMFHPFDHGVVVRDENGYVIAHIIKPIPKKGKIPRDTWWVEYTKYATRREMLIIEEGVREGKIVPLRGCRKLIDKTNPEGYDVFFY